MSKMIGIDETIDFFGEVSGILDDNDVDVDRDFPEEYTCAMNRLRYMRNKEYGAKKKIVKAKVRSCGYFVYCGNCRYELTNNPHYKFCPNCGYKIRD